MITPKVSVVIPIYNAERYLSRCIDSVCAQTLEDIEIILINDGSLDKSAEICERYLSDGRVSCYHKENEGLAAARRDGISRARGEYVGFVDSDDWVERDMYESMYNAASENRADIVFCNCIENENGHRFAPEMPSGLYERDGILKHILPKTLAYIDKNGDKRAIRWSNWLRIYRRALLVENNITFDGRFRRSQDLQLTYEATLCAQRYYYMGESYLYHNRYVPNSLSRGYTKNMWQLYRMLIERLYEVTRAFSEADLTAQMHLRAFFFVTDCIDNEFKKLCPNDRRTKVSIISEIMNDPICEGFYGFIPTKKLNRLLSGYYRFIHEKDAPGLIAFVRRYRIRQSLTNKIYKPLVRFITESRLTGGLYKRLRKK